SGPPPVHSAGGHRVDVVLEKRQVQRAYELYAPIYDFIFDWIFAPGRAAAIARLALQPTDRVLEVGIGTGLNLPLYPPAVHLTGIDLSQEMLDKAVERVQTLTMPSVTLKVMDATSMDFGDNEFDKAVATYVISAVPDPVSVLREVRRVVRPGGTIVILNHFRSERRVFGHVEDFVAPGSLSGAGACPPVAPPGCPGGPHEHRTRGGSACACRDDVAHRRSRRTTRARRRRDDVAGLGHADARVRPAGDAAQAAGRRV